jgi:hypothetical protein
MSARALYFFENHTKAPGNVPKQDLNNSRTTSLNQSSKSIRNTIQLLLESIDSRSNILIELHNITGTRAFIVRAFLSVVLSSLSIILKSLLSFVVAFWDRQENAKSFPKLDGFLKS